MRGTGRSFEMRSHRRWTRWWRVTATATILVMGTVGGSLGTALAARTGGRAPITLYTGPAGANTDAGDVARANVTNLNATTQKAQLSLMQEDGIVLLHQTFTLAPGASGFFDVFSVGTGRHEVRGAALVGNRNFRLSLEVFDGTTRETSFHCIPSVGKGTVRSSPIVGLTGAQTARIAVANVGTATETGTVTFLDMAGLTLAKADVTDDIGDIVYFDYTDVTIKDRLPIRAVVSLSDANFTASFELFDTKTGRTDVYVEEVS
jgi:hypothetical protein